MKGTKNTYVNDLSRKNDIFSSYETKSKEDLKDTPVLAVFERLEKEEYGKKKEKNREEKKKKGLSMFCVFSFLFVSIFGMMQSPHILYSLAQQLYNQQKYEEAIFFYDKAAIVGKKFRQEEYSNMSNRAIADYYYDCGKYDEAAKYYESMIEQVDLERIDEIASQYYKNKDYENAMKWYQFSGNHEKVLNIQKEVADEHYENKEYEEAAKYYEEIGDRESYHKAVNAMAFSCYNEGKYEEAINWYKKIGHTSGIHMAQVKLAEQYYEVGDYENAILYYESAGEMERALEIKKSMADNYYENKEYKKAKLLYEELLESEISFMTKLEIMMKKGRCESELGK